MRKQRRRCRAQRGLMSSQLDLEAQRRVRRNGAAGAALAIGELGRADELGLAADLHLLHAFGPALDDAAEREHRRRVALVRAVELGAVGERAAVVDLDRVGRRRARAGALAQRLVGARPRRGGARARRWQGCATARSGVPARARGQPVGSGEARAGRMDVSWSRFWPKARPGRLR